MKKIMQLLMAFTLVTFLSCEDTLDPAITDAPTQAKAPSDDEGGEINEFMANMNASLAASGANVAFQMAEYLGVGVDGGATVGQTVFANDRTKQLTAQWVPNDPRRLADGDNLTYLNDQTFSIANGSIDSEPAIDASWSTWDGGTQCSDLTIVKREDTGANPNFVLSMFFNLGSPADPFLADVTETGFLPGFVFDGVLGPGASGGVLGVAFTLIFVDENGDPTDINGDGFIDKALAEVWYNDNFLWSDTGSGGIDIETVALHENGHTLGIGHFGKIFRTDKNGKIHFAPRAVMNASYSGVRRDLKGTDNASHCSIYGNWPNNGIEPI